jgi:anti-repressor protein
MSADSVPAPATFSSIMRDGRWHDSGYWLASELMPLFGYSEWSEFAKTINKAATALAVDHVDQYGKAPYVDQHFARQLERMGRVSVPGDYQLTRTACHLTALYADPDKPQVRDARAYFAVETREKETAPMTTVDNTDRFVFPDTGYEVRTVTINDDPWFVVADVCKNLGIGNPSDAARRLNGDDLDTVEVIDSLGRKQKVHATNESGLYDLILDSRKPWAREFRRWIVSEVIPAIRKTGQYVAVPKTYAEALRAAADASEQAEQAKEQLAIAAPKVEAFDTYLSATGKYLVGEVAKMLAVPDMGPVKLHAFLRGRGVLMTEGNRRNMPYQQHIDAGRFTVEGAVRRNAQTGELITREDGLPIGARTTHVTPKGVEYIRSLLVQAGHRPAVLELTA